MAPRFRKYEIDYSLISSDTATPEYRPKPTVRQVPAHYFEPGVVAFTKPDEREIAMPPIEKIPYENGVHA